MLTSNAIAFVSSLFYFVAVLLTAELLRNWFKLSALVVRRLTILGLAHSVLVLPPLFSSWAWFALAPGVFAAIYLFASGSGTLRGSRGSGVFGAVYLFVAIIFLFYFFWPSHLQPFAIAGVLALAWGDSLAALVGRKIGRHQYYIYDEEKSWEGTLAMFAGAFGSSVFVGSRMLGLAGEQLLAYATLTAGFATILEAISVRRSDNLVVPVGASFILYYLIQTNIPSAQISLLVTGIVGSFILAIAAYWLKALDEGGVAGVVLVGSFAYTFGGWNWIPALLVFFITSSILTVWSRRKQPPDNDDDRQGRGIDQVLANGGPGVVLAVLSFLNIFEPHLLFVGFLGSIAGVTADTWSTEIGMAIGGRPRKILSRKEVLPGTSGAVTRAGFGGALAGSLLIAFSAVVLFAIGGLNWQVTAVSAGAVLLAGFLGSVVDSLIGAWFQVQYYCDYCLKFTEQEMHSCGCQTRPVQGLSWMDNNWVNFLSSIISAVLAMGFYLIGTWPN